MGEQEEKYHWLIIFRKGTKVYPYLYRTIPEMTEIVRASHGRHGSYPHRMWVIVDDEIRKVVIT